MQRGYFSNHFSLTSHNGLTSKSSTNFEAEFTIYEDDDNEKSPSPAMVRQQREKNRKSRKALQNIAHASRKAQLEAWRSKKRVQTISGNENKVHFGSENVDPRVQNCKRTKSENHSNERQCSSSSTPNSAANTNGNAMLSSPSSVPQLIHSSAGRRVLNKSSTLQCSVYVRSSGKGKKWVKRGSGKGTISFVPSLTNQTSLQVRSKDNLALLANFTLSKARKLTAQSSKSWTIKAEDFSKDCEGKWTQFLLRFAHANEAAKFKQTFDSHQDGLNPEASPQMATPKESKVSPTPPVSDQRQEESDADVEEVVRLLRTQVEELQLQLLKETESRKRETAKYQRLLDRVKSIVNEREDS